MQRTLLLVLAALLLLALTIAGALFYRAQVAEPPDAAPTPGGMESSGIIGLERPAFRFPDHVGVMRDVAEWDGQVLMVNFWAAWCVPCRREIPAFVDLQARYGPEGLQIVGIALDEQAPVERFLAETGIQINYPLLISADVKGIDVARAYGNRLGVLPYTVFVDRTGRIAYAQFGEISHAEAEREIRALLVKNRWQ